MTAEKRIIKTAAFFALLALCLFICIGIVERKESRRKYADMKEASESADVLLLGSSHVINGLNPVKLYEDHGIAAYNLGGHGSVLPASYYELLLALESFTPRLVVLDGYMMERDYHYLDLMTDEFTDEDREGAVSQLHLNLDVFPLSRTKVRAVRDLISDDSIRAQFLFPFTLYHNRWSALTADDFAAGKSSKEANRLLGAEIRMGVDWRIAPHSMGDDDIEDGVHVGEQYLQMILAECRTRGIELALIYLPCNSTAADRATAKRLDVLSEAEGLHYLNMLASDPTDIKTDYNDEGHLNLLGMNRATTAVGEFLKESFDIPDRRGDESYSLWADRAEEYHQTLDEELKEAQSLTEALLIMAAEPGGCDALVYMPGTGMAVGDPSVKALIDAALPENGLRDSAFSGEPAFFAVSSTGGYRDLCGYGVTDWTDAGLTCGRELELIAVEGFTGAYLGGDESENMLDMEDARLSDAQLTLLDPADGSVKKRLLFNYQ